MKPVAITASILLAAVEVRAAEPSTAAPPPTEPGTRVTALWALLQLIPSPEVVVWDGVVRFGARWQVTPLLYSYGINRKLSPWRSLVAEPNVRHGGSIELFVSPEVLSGSFSSAADRFVLHAGLRSYFPLLYRGDYLSGSVGGAALFTHGKVGAGVDLGLHTFGGMLGLRVGYCPTRELRMTTLAIEIRIF